MVQQYETAQGIPAAVRAGALRRSRLLRTNGHLPGVAEMEWRALGNSINPWGVTMLRTLRTTEPRSVSEQTAYSKWFDQRSDREDGRADRTHGAEGVIPVPVWIVLFIASGTIFVYMLFFADSAERKIVQATMIGGVAVVVAFDAASAVVPRQPVPQRSGRPSPGGDGAHAHAPPSGAGVSRRRACHPVRCAREGAARLSGGDGIGEANAAPMDEETRVERWLDRALGRARTPRGGAERGRHRPTWRETSPATS